MRFEGALALLAAAVPGHAVAQIYASQFPQRILAAHNAERSAAGVQQLRWDPMLSAGAAAYAQQMAASGRFEHSNRQARRGIGENLWMGSHGAFSPEAMVGGWAAEKRWFMSGVFPNNSRTGSWEDVGHYTQMIWPSTNRVGCAVATGRGIDYLVCRYATAGNIDGRMVGYRLAANGTAARYRR